MIKKVFFCLSLFLLSQWGIAQSVDDLFKEYAKAYKVENVKINKFLMTLIKPFAKEGKHIDSVHVLDLSKCSNDTKEQFTQKVKKLKDKKYETLVRSNEDNETTLILVAVKNDVIRELVVITTGEDCALVRLKGKIKQSDITSLANN